MLTFLCVHTCMCVCVFALVAAYDMNATNLRKRKFSYVFTTQEIFTFHYKFGDYASSYSLHIQVYENGTINSHFLSVQSIFFACFSTKFNDLMCSHFEWVAFFIIIIVVARSIECHCNFRAIELLI